MIESHYAVNVATNYGSHFCKIKLPTTLTKAEAIERARLIARKFGEDFRVDMTRVECVGHTVEL